MTNEEYHARQELGSTRIKSALKSYAEFVESATPTEPTPAMFLGTAIHAAVLEPDVFAATYATAPKFDRRTNAGKAAAEEWAAANEGKTPLTPDQLHTIKGVRASLKSHTNAAALLWGKGVSETPVFWQDEETGLSLKCKPDRLTSKRAIVDLKTTSDASAAAFGRDAFKYMYPLSAAHYMAGVEGATAFIIVSVETQPPYHAAVYIVGKSELAVGEFYRRKALRTIAEGRAHEQQTGEILGLSQEIQTLQLPAWAYNI